MGTGAGIGMDAGIAVNKMRETRIRRRKTLNRSNPIVGSADNPGPWHYVGETGEPAFENSWANIAVGLPGLAFRIAGPYVELTGIMIGGAPSTTIFTIPAEYRPSITAQVITSITANLGTGEYRFDGLTVNTDGTVVAPPYLSGFVVLSFPKGATSYPLVPADPAS